MKTFSFISTELKMLRLNYCLFIIVQLYGFSVCLTTNVIDHAWDLPTDKELYKYLSTVKTVVDYCAEYKDEVDINLAFGLFLTNINLGHTLHKKQRMIPEIVRNQIKYIINENNEILDDFIFKESVIESKKGEDGKMKNLKSILSLFNNATHWVESLEKFVYTVEKRYTPDQLREMYSPFRLYMKKVGNFLKGSPTPDDSDDCLISLSKNPRNMKGSPPRCSVDDFCHDMLKRGTNFGYSLSHRIVFLLMARFGRRCCVFSEQTDRAMVKQFCSTAHAEAEYIVENSYGLADLFMEIIVLCTVDGHSQFLNRIWLDNILKFQTPEGCFGTIPVKKIHPIRRSFFVTEMGKSNLLQEGCNAHTTGLAAATFSAAVRLIIEKYY
ncbi:uncharacterized protein LOC123881308 [Maniola jurtina]|uniref:uncharacterized protein LOC123881308 n=1 Tax=Maniola jurtina TaxID=191418 RepID=UPI001E68EBCE|nr:uncharacterized protein LOC123881308 [Maniola jurtina]